MWGQSSHHNPSASDIPTTLIKHFNPYEILEPQKVTLKEEKLIDIEPDNSRNCSNEITGINALMPKINPDLIDLYENIYVTPHHIERQRQINEKIDEQIDENIRQITDLSKSNLRKEISSDLYNISLSNNSNEDSDAPKVLVPPKLKLVTKLPVFAQTIASDKIITQNLTAETHDLSQDDDFEDPEKLLDEILHNKSYEMYMKSQNETKATTHSTKIHTNNIFTKPSQIHKMDPPMKPNNEKINEDRNIKLLNTVKKDEKQYIKKRIIKSDASKSGFTKGPDVREKSIVLPQLRARIEARDKALEDRKALKPRLILDTGSARKDLNSQKLKTPVLYNPVVLMEDCNRERLIGFKTREAFENFVRSGRF